MIVLAILAGCFVASITTLTIINFFEREDFYRIEDEIESFHKFQRAIKGDK